MTQAVITLSSSKNYGAWSLRGWLLVKLSGLEFTEKVLPPDDADMRAEILLLSSSILVPSLLHDGIKVWDTLAIGEYLHEIKPKAGLLPADRA
ncbi:MAG TPA: glutathione S-transferase N-terminal domain-containing protein, partial [Polaromonas sp.]